jgi:hypothetical protein
LTEGYKQQVSPPRVGRGQRRGFFPERDIFSDTRNSPGNKINGDGQNN